MNDAIAERLRGIISWIGVVLGIIAISLALYFNHNLNEKTQDVLHSSLQSQCDRQHDSAQQWHQVIGVLEEQSSRQTGTVPPGIKELAERTYAIYDHFPACKLLQK